ncbi:MAG: His/Gly/Thr/Pro-type tRNA ligase C-terminal domain-containing protein [Candidatus Nomurabacteria bacterium]|nr:His/Gly/Thr/Pro-type tRNA ligase C-terminal domain-containing protein [Candidatus Nomurabacteria bacterium]
MKQSHLFSKTRKDAPKDEVSKNAQLLIRAGYIHKEMAGVYSFLPLGLRVIEKITDIIRDELNKAGCQELKMTTLQRKEIWEQTDRWRNDLDGGIWFKTELNGGSELGLAFTHEEALANIMKDHINSYKDLPKYAYQFQTKFRNELRAKSGILRGREFLMKDLYDFSKNKEEHEDFYEKMKGVYMNIFTRAGIGENTYMTISSGGSFSKYSYEFQTICEAGEDILVYDPEKKIAINKGDFSDEVFSDFDLNKDDYNFQEAKSIEVGDIYTLGEKYSSALDLKYTDEKGEEHPVYMGSYGIGVPRLMGAIVEIFADSNGIVWPESVSPFAVHLVQVGDSDTVNAEAEKIYTELVENNIEVLWDDRDSRPGQKFADSDLIGIPHRIVVSEKTIEAEKLEYKKRTDQNGDASMMSLEEIVKNIQ